MMSVGDDFCHGVRMNSVLSFFLTFDAVSIKRLEEIFVIPGDESESLQLCFDIISSNSSTFVSGFPSFEFIGS